MSVTIRAARSTDAAACAAIYRPYVLDTAISFEAEPPAPAEMARRIEAAHAWLVAEIEDTIIGYAYAGPFAARPSYRWSCEVSIYVDATRRGTGTGRALYGALLPLLAERGYRTAVAKTTLPNDASRALHQAFGFEPVGVHRGIGWKHGAWHDVAITQLTLIPGDGPPTGQA